MSVGAQALALVGLLLAAGCLDLGVSVRRAPSPDIDSPPVDIPEEELVDFIDPPEPGTPYTLHGRVLDPLARPIEGARVWVESTDLRQPVNNVAKYTQSRDATLRTTDGRGAWQINLQGGFYYVLATKPGYLPVRAEAVPSPDGSTRVDIYLPLEGPTKVLAHRAGALYAPENTQTGITKSLLLGAHMIEIDVRLTLDHQLVVIHDETVDRTTNGLGPVRLHNASQIARLDAGSWFDASFAGERVPTLRAVLDRARTEDFEVIVDIKADDENATVAWTRVLEAIDATGTNPRAIFASFDVNAVAWCGATERHRCALISRGPGTGADMVEEARALGATGLLLRHNLFDAAAMNAARTAGIRMFVWTMNDADEWDRVLDLEPHGVLTDIPGYLLDRVAERALVR